MNELIVNTDGSVTTVGDTGSVSGILAELVEANTIPEERDADNVITKEAVVPDADTLAVEVTAEELKPTHGGCQRHEQNGWNKFAALVTPS